MRITLNLATRPFADLGPALKRLRIGMGALALVAILLVLGLRAIHQEAEAARARDHSLDGQLAHITQERESYQSLMRQPDNAKLLEQSAMLNKLFDEKAFSWTLAMEDLETVLPGGVQVGTLEPARQKDGHIALKLRVVGPRDRAVDLVRNLEHSRRFLFPRIVGENSESTEKPGQRQEPVSAADRVDFDLMADYNPATPQERKATKKTAPRSEASEEAARPAAHPVRPLPTPAAGNGRPPYTGPAKPVSPRFVPPDNAQPQGKTLGRPPYNPPNPQPSSQPNSQPNSQPGGPQ